MYYLSSDLNDGFFYIGLQGRPEKPFLIKFDKRYKADNYLRKLNAKLVKNPLEDDGLYLFEGYFTHPKISGQVSLYRLKAN